MEMPVNSGDGKTRQDPLHHEESSLSSVPDVAPVRAPDPLLCCRRFYIRIRLRWPPWKSSRPRSAFEFACELSFSLDYLRKHNLFCIEFSLDLFQLPPKPSHRLRKDCAMSGRMLSIAKNKYFALAPPMLRHQAVRHQHRVRAELVIVDRGGGRTAPNECEEGN